MRCDEDVVIDYQPCRPSRRYLRNAGADPGQSIGSDPAVAIDPPATMKCALAAGLAMAGGESAA
jgi:hypothetical protein